MVGTPSATSSTVPSVLAAKGHVSLKANGVGGRVFPVLRGSGKDEVETSSSGDRPLDRDSMEFSEIQDLLKVVDDSDVVEFEMKSDDFTLCLRKHQETEPSAAYAQPQVVQAVPTVAAAPPPQMVAAPPPTPVQNGSASVARKVETPAKPAAPAQSASGVTMLSPMAGTFYRCPGPNEPKFVNVGDEVKVGQTVCIIEAMKLMNEIEAESSGKILEILIDDSTAVDVGTPLFIIG